jgi:hypothetical protein
VISLGTAARFVEGRALITMLSVQGRQLEGAHTGWAGINHQTTAALAAIEFGGRRQKWEQRCAVRVAKHGQTLRMAQSPTLDQAVSQACGLLAWSSVIFKILVIDGVALRMLKVAD